MASLVLFLLGATLGTGLDHWHVAGGATSYAHPAFWGQAIWVPALFGFAAAGFGDQHHRLRGLLKATDAPRSALWVDAALFVGAYAISAFVRLDHAVMGALFMGAFFLRWLQTGRSRLELVHGLVCAVVGAGVETQLTRLGLFTHHQADLLGIPFWLPGLYALAGPFLGGLDDRLRAKFASA